VIHCTTAGYDMYIAPIETPSRNIGWRASCPQIPGCVVTHWRRELTILLVNDAIDAVARDGAAFHGN
jgi:hypothetical protein